jgi:hypothetical protein
MRPVLALIIFAALCYAAVTAYAGFRVARGIDDAKASSVVARVGTQMMGRDAVERLAIRKGNVPGWITQSPTFWLTLRATE